MSGSDLAKIEGVAIAGIRVRGAGREYDIQSDAKREGQLQRGKRGRSLECQTSRVRLSRVAWTGEGGRTYSGMWLTA